MHASAAYRLREGQSRGSRQRARSLSVFARLQRYDSFGDSADVRRRQRRRSAMPRTEQSGRSRKPSGRDRYRTRAAALDGIRRPSRAPPGRTPRPAQLLGVLCENAAAMTPRCSTGGVYREVASARGAGGESHSLSVPFCARRDLDTPAVGRQAWCIVAPWQTVPHTSAGRVGPREFTSARRGRGSWRVGRATRAGVRSAS